MLPKKILIVIILISLPSVLVYSEKITILTDQYWNTMLERELSNDSHYRIVQKIKEVLHLNSGFRIGMKKISKIVIKLQDSRSAALSVKDELGDIKKGIVIVSPLLSVYAADYAKDYPDLRFILPVVNRTKRNSDNVVFALIDYSTAMEKAGSLAASMEKDVYGLFFTKDPFYKSNKEAFLKGWNDSGGGSKLHIDELNRADDSGGYEAFANKVLEHGGIAAIFGGQVNEDILSAFAGSKIEIITIGIDPWINSENKISASVDLSFKTMVSDILEYIGNETYGAELVIEAELFSYGLE